MFFIYFLFYYYYYFFLLLDAFLLKKISKKHLMSFLLLIICLDLSKLIFIYTMEPSRECIIIEIILIQVYLITHQAGIGPIPLILNTKLYEKFLSLGGAAISVFTKLSNTFAFLVFPLGEEKKKKRILNTLTSDTRNFKEFEFKDPHSLIWPKLSQAINVDSMLIIIATKCRQMW